MLAEEAADPLDVRFRGRPQLPEAVRRELRVAHARVALARHALAEAVVLQAREQPRDPGRRQQYLLRQIDPPQPPIGRAREAQQHLVVAQRQAVVRDELRVETTRRRRMRTQEPGERLNLRSCLSAQYLTSQSSLAILLTTQVYPKGATAQCPQLQARQFFRSARGTSIPSTRRSASRSRIRATCSARSPAASRTSKRSEEH